MVEHFRKEDYPCSEHSTAISKLAQTMEDFIARSIENSRACQDRYERDREENMAWRNELRTRMETVERFISSLQPDHKMLMTLAFAMILGSLTLVWRIVWLHVTAGVK